MSDEFGTVSVRRGDRAREIERLRQSYREHRDTLMRLVSDAPTEHLATEYHRLVRDIDNTLAKIDEIEGRGGTSVAAASATAGGAIGAAAASMPADVPPAVPPRGATPVGRAQGDPLRAETLPGDRPLIPPPGVEHEAAPAYEAGPGTGSRMTLIAVAAIIVLALIGWLIWRASSERRPAAQVTPATEPPAAVTAPVTPAPTPAGLVITPAVLDFGTVGKGTRAARQLEITNNTSGPIAIQVSRSQCHCLFYEYAKQIDPKKRETITVTVDGARAKAGTLDETLTVSAKKDPSVSTTFQVTGAVK